MALRFSSGRIFRAVLTLGPAMWLCMSMPPAITTSPVALSVRLARAWGSLGGLTIRPSRTQMSPTLPSMPEAGS